MVDPGPFLTILYVIVDDFDKQRLCFDAGTGLCDPEGTAPHRLRHLAELTTCSKNFWALMRLPWSFHRSLC